ncbi:hypothetical protein LCGC14_2306000, partial [marine sediment metagenome]
MTFATLIARSLRHYWRTHLGVTAGAAAASAVLIGALVVGDSVRGSLRDQALARLGRVDVAMTLGEGFFRARLAEGVAADLSATAAAVLSLDGIAASDSARANGVQVLGVDGRFWSLSPGGSGPAAGDMTDGVILNRRLADQLGARVGEVILVRVDKPGILPRDAPLSSTDDASAAARLTVRAIADDAAF